MSHSDEEDLNGEEDTEECPVCEGNGVTKDGEKCENCDGFGYIE